MISIWWGQVLTGCRPNHDRRLWGSPGEVFSKGTIFALIPLDAPIRLMAAPGQAQRIKAPVEMILWGYSVLVWRLECRWHAWKESDCTFRKDLPAATAERMGPIPLRDEADVLGTARRLLTLEVLHPIVKLFLDYNVSTLRNQMGSLILSVR